MYTGVAGPPSVFTAFAASRIASFGGRTRLGATLTKLAARSEEGDAQDCAQRRLALPNAAEDRRHAAREKHEQWHEQVAQVARNDVGLTDPEEMTAATGPAVRMRAGTRSARVGSRS